MQIRLSKRATFMSSWEEVKQTTVEMRGCALPLFLTSYRPHIFGDYGYGGYGKPTTKICSGELQVIK